MHIAKTVWYDCVFQETSENSFTITGLTAGTEYQFCVLAQNLAGFSKPSEPSEMVKTPGKNNLRI